jgi:ribose-phosphate pyrophosphokinase
MSNSSTPFKIFSGTKSHYLAEEIANNLGVELGKMNIQRFADGEFEVSFEESIRGDEVYLIQSTFPNCDNLMELLLMIDAAKRASAKAIIAVVPYFGWARQDRKDKPRVSIAAKTRCRPIEHSRYQPPNHNGPSCRPDSRIL